MAISRSLFIFFDNSYAYNHTYELLRWLWAGILPSYSILLSKVLAPFVSFEPQLAGGHRDGNVQIRDNGGGVGARYNDAKESIKGINKCKQGLGEEAL